MVIGGFTDPQGSRTGFGALLLGVYDNGKLRYSGKVGTGFDEQSLGKHSRAARQARAGQAAVRESAARLRGQGRPLGQAGPRRGDRLHRVERRRRAAPSVVPGPARRQEGDGRRARGAAAGAGASTARPGDRETVRREGTARDVTRQGSREAPAPTRAGATVAGVTISNPDKLYFPEAGITKIDVARYFERMAPWILPHIEGRPLSLVRCPDGWNRQCFYQKHADKSVNAAVDRIKVPEGNGTAMYMGARSAKALVALVQWGVIELHPWGSRTPAPRAARSADLRLRSRRSHRVEGSRHRRRAPAHAAGRARSRGVSQDDRRQGAARRRPDSGDARLDAGEGLHPRGRRLHGEDVRRSLHGDRVEGAAQGQDLHRLSAQRRGRHGDRAVRRARARQRAGLHADRLGGARDGRALRPLQRAQRRRAVSPRRSAIRGATS